MSRDELTVLDLLYDPVGTRERIRRQLPLHPATDDCPDLECLVCGARDCPHGEPLHYHHDGCPAGWFCPHKAPGAWHCRCARKGEGA